MNLTELKKSLAKLFILRLVRRLIRWLFDPSFRKTNSLIFADEFWHLHVSSFIAIYLSFLYYPLVIYSRNNKILFSINNITNAVGHIYPEIDYIHRMRLVGIISSESRVICIWPKNSVNDGFVKLQNNSSITFILSGLLEALIYPMLMRYKEITVNASQSVLNYHLYLKNEKYHISQPLSFRQVFRKRQVEYFKLRKNTSTHFPLKKNLILPNQLKNFIGCDNYYVIQIKDISVNATINPTNPNTYISTLELINNLGFSVVFAGREKMPPIFKDLNVINYSESKFANSTNDFLLISNAKGVIASASGFCYIPDLLNIPLLSINNWVQIGYAGSKTIQIPSLINYLNGKKMKFTEQLNLAYEIGQITSTNKLPKDKFECIDASADDIVEGFKEMINLNNSNLEMTALQTRYNNLFENEPIFFQLSRIANKFLERNIDRF